MSFEQLADFPKRVADLMDGVFDAHVPVTHGEWAAVDHVCHLRDLESEGHAVRIARLLSEDDPLLRDFDGDGLAIERRYREQDPREALRAFADARARNVALLASVPESAFAREGTFETGGRVSLAQLVERMREHDAGHLRDLQALAALDHFARHRGQYREDLDALCRIPGISAADAAAVRRSAEATARVLERHGIAKVQLLEVEGAHPSVYGEVIVDPNAPTVLIYGHHDVQPVGDLGRWTTPPFEPVERDGRLYARGSSDDKGGVMAHVAAAASWRGAPPCNVRFFIEGEEEIGSPNLGRFLDRYRDLLQADAVVLADTPNADTGIPGLTTRLRGMCMIDVEVRCLERPLHSGRGAGSVPDAIAILCQLIAAITPLPAERGEGGAERRVRGHANDDDERFRRAAGLLDGVALVGPRERTWSESAITVIGFDAPPVERAFNQIVPSARARLSVRTVPPRRSEETAEEVVARLLAVPMPHALVSARVVKSVQWWRTDATGPAFDAARRALTRGYRREAQFIGSGGTIGFVGMFERAFPGTPLLLMGVEDPPCNAHSENESLHLGDWESCVRSSILFLDEFSR